MQTFEARSIKYTYSPEHAPIGTVKPGESFVVITEDGFSGRYNEPGSFTPETAAWVEENLDGVTGPIAIEGAEPGQAVAITIDEVEVITPGTVVVSRCDAISPSDWWHQEDHVVHLPVSGHRIHIRGDWVVEARPLIGCLATSPRQETILSRHEGDFGGNLDCREITEGATVLLPVEIPGAGLYFGDCKAAMGDGEIVSAPEVGTRIVASAALMDRPAAMSAPRVITPDHLMTIVSGPSLTDAARTAFRELKHWIEHDWDLTSDAAAIVLGIGAHCGIAQVSNKLHTAKCSIARSLEPPA